MTISSTQLYQRNSEIITSEIENETVMMDTSYESYFGLHAIGTQVWKMLENPHSIEQIAESLIERYDVSLQQCVADLTPLFSDFVANDMIHPVE